MGLGSLVYDAGTRPDAEAVVAAAVQSSFAVTYNAKDWLEVLRDGLTFDLSGLSPGPGHTLSSELHAVGVKDQREWLGAEALEIKPGPHLAGAENLLPVVRVAASLMAALGSFTCARALAWNPAGNLVRTDWFVNAVKSWEGGGPFPSQALCSYLPQSGSDLVSRGLKFLCGQEFELVTSPGDLPYEARKVAMRLSDWLVAHGRVEAPREVILSGIGALWLEPDADDLIIARML